MRLSNLSRMTKKIPRVFTRGKKSVVLLEVAGIELIILAVLGNQLVMRAALDDAALFEHHDAVAVAHGGKAVRDDKRGAALHQGIHARLHELLGAGIDGAGRFIENQHGRIGDGRARDGEQLTLALRKVAAVALEHGVVTIRQASDGSRPRWPASPPRCTPHPSRPAGHSGYSP